MDGASSEDEQREYDVYDGYDAYDDAYDDYGGLTVSSERSSDEDDEAVVEVLPGQIEVEIPGAQNDVSMAEDGPDEFDVRAVYDVSSVRPTPPQLPEGSATHPNLERLVENASKKKEPDIEPSPKNRRCFEDSVEDDGQNCTICFEPWTNASEHRLVSLRCGHLFGRSCISRWLKGQNARCPQCNARARKSEIRNIYARTVKAVDSTERDKALQDLQKESERRKKAEMELTETRLKHMMKVAECEMLKKNLIEANKLLDEFRGMSKTVENSQSAKKVSPVFSLEKAIEIAKNGGCKLVDVCALLGMVLVSQPSINELFPGFGFRKISTMDMKPSEFVLIHQKPIKDMAFHCHDGLVLTASLDKSVRITNVLTNSVVHTYSVDFDAWSCAWDSDNPTYFYAGVKSGGVYLFDIRVTSRYVHELPTFGYRTPVVALQYLRKASCSRQSVCGPIVGKLSDCGFYQKLAEQAYNVVPLPISGPFFSLSSEPDSGHFLVSCRPSQFRPHVTHTLCEFMSSPAGPLCHPVQTIQGGRSQVQLTKSKLLPHPDDDSSLLICAGDEEANGALIWDGSSGKTLDHLRTNSPVLDFANLKHNHKSLLLGLTDKALRLYSWKSQ